MEQFLELGFLPEAIFNFVILLGWAPKDNRELYSLDEFVAAFDPAGLQKSNPVLNLKKLDWFNGHYIRAKSDADLLQLIKPYLPEITPQIIPLIKDRLTTLAGAKSLAGFFFLLAPISPITLISPISSLPSQPFHLPTGPSPASTLRYWQCAISRGFPVATSSCPCVWPSVAAR